MSVAGNLCFANFDGHNCTYQKSKGIYFLKGGMGKNMLVKIFFAEIISNGTSCSGFV